jgi:hypothetical protein
LDHQSRTLRNLPAACLVLAVLVGGPVHADTTIDRLEPAIGNTIVSTHPDGRKARLWLERGGRYSAEGRSGGRSGGTWKLKGDKLCLHQHRPFPVPISYCKPVPMESLNKPWRDKAVTGEPVVNEIVPGAPPASWGG